METNGRATGRSSQGGEVNTQFSEKLRMQAIIYLIYAKEISIDRSNRPNQGYHRSLACILIP